MGEGQVGTNSQEDSVSQKPSAHDQEGSMKGPMGLKGIQKMGGKEGISTVGCCGWTGGMMPDHGPLSWWPKGALPGEEQPVPSRSSDTIWVIVAVV